MANFQSVGKVENVTVKNGQQRPYCIVTIREKPDKEPIEMVYFGSPPPIGSDVLAIGFVESRKNGQYLNTSLKAAHIGIVGHQEQLQELPPAPQQAMPPPPRFETEDEAIPF